MQTRKQQENLALRMKNSRGPLSVASTTMSKYFGAKMKRSYTNPVKPSWVIFERMTLEILALPCVYMESLKAFLTQDAVTRSHSRQDAAWNGPIMYCP